MRNLLHQIVHDIIKLSGDPTKLFLSTLSARNTWRVPAGKPQLSPSILQKNKIHILSPESRRRRDNYAPAKIATAMYPPV